MMPVKLNMPGLVMVICIPVFCALLFVSRHLAIYGQWGTHLSNFALSMPIVFCVGSAVAVTRKPLVIARVCAVILVFANVLVESFVTVMNIPDIADALFGIAGTVTAYGLVEILHSRGVKDHVL